MDARDRARQITNDLGSFADPMVKDWLSDKIAAAIDAAVAAERERCAADAKRISALAERGLDGRIAIDEALSVIADLAGSGNIDDARSYADAAIKG